MDLLEAMDKLRILNLETTITHNQKLIAENERAQAKLIKENEAMQLLVDLCEIELTIERGHNGNG